MLRVDGACRSLKQVNMGQHCTKIKTTFRLAHTARSVKQKTAAKSLGKAEMSQDLVHSVDEKVASTNDPSSSSAKRRRPP